MSGTCVSTCVRISQDVTVETNQGSTYAGKSFDGKVCYGHIQLMQ